MKKGFLCGLVSGVLTGYFLCEYREEIIEVLKETGEKIHGHLEKCGTGCPHTKAADLYNELKIVLKGDQAPAEAIKEYKYAQGNFVDVSFEDDTCPCCENVEEKKEEISEESDDEDPDEIVSSEKKMEIAGNNNSMIFHLTSCRHAPKKSENAVFFESMDAAEKAGYKPCSRCIEKQIIR